MSRAHPYVNAVFENNLLKQSSGSITERLKNKLMDNKTKFGNCNELSPIN